MFMFLHIFLDCKHVIFVVILQNNMDIGIIKYYFKLITKNKNKCNLVYFIN